MEKTRRARIARLFESDLLQLVQRSAARARRQAGVACATSARKAGRQIPHFRVQPLHLHARDSARVLIGFGPPNNGRFRFGRSRAQERSRIK